MSLIYIWRLTHLPADSQITDADDLGLLQFASTITSWFMCGLKLGDLLLLPKLWSYRTKQMAKLRQRDCELGFGCPKPSFMEHAYDARARVFEHMRTHAQRHMSGRNLMCTCSQAYIVRAHTQVCTRFAHAPALARAHKHARKYRWRDLALPLHN